MCVCAHPFSTGPQWITQAERRGGGQSPHVCLFGVTQHAPNAVMASAAGKLDEREEEACPNRGSSVHHFSGIFSESRVSPELRWAGVRGTRRAPGTICHFVFLSTEPPSCSREHGPVRWVLLWGGDSCTVWPWAHPSLVPACLPPSPHSFPLSLPHCFPNSTAPFYDLR